MLRGRREVVTAQERRAVPELVAYWFMELERVVATHAGRIWRDDWNRLTRGRPDRWAYILAQTGVMDDEAAARTRMQAVRAGTLPACQIPLPERCGNRRGERLELGAKGRIACADFDISKRRRLRFLGLRE